MLDQPGSVEDEAGEGCSR